MRTVLTWPAMAMVRAAHPTVCYSHHNTWTAVKYKKQFYRNNSLRALRLGESKACFKPDHQE